MVEILQEVTDWVDNPSLNDSNGIYWVCKRQGLVAFQPPQGEKVVFEKPMRNFSKTRRKFKKIGVEND